MALVHHREQVGADVVALTCHECGTRYAGDQLEELLILDELRCLDTFCGAGGMIAHKQSKLEERFPPEIATPYVPIPVALLKQVATLGIGAPELAVIVALERHRRVMGDEVWSFRGPLSEQTGLSVDQVKRATSRLVAAGLLERRQGGSLEHAKGRGPNWYSLDPLWQRVADLERTGAPQTPGDLKGNSAPQTEASERAPDLRAHAEAFAGAEDPICGALVHQEVEVGSRELPREEPYGTRPAEPDRAVVSSTSSPRIIRQRHPAVPGLTTDLENWHSRKAAQT